MTTQHFESEEVPGGANLRFTPEEVGVIERFISWLVNTGRDAGVQDLEALARNDDASPLAPLFYCDVPPSARRHEEHSAQEIARKPFAPPTRRQ